MRPSTTSADTVRRLILAGLAAWLPLLAQALPHRVHGTVTHVTDGDSVWVRPISGGEPLEVRIQGIDAPEICQPWGPQAQAALAQQLEHQPVELDVRGRDDYGRTLARVHWMGHDVGAMLVGNGLAWSYRWRGRAGPYDALQEQARNARQGLWSQGRAEPPRNFRRRHGPCPHPSHR